MKTVYHPSLPATQEVPDDAVEEWVAQGWRKTAPKDIEQDSDNQKGAKS